MMMYGVGNVAAIVVLGVGFIMSIATKARAELPCVLLTALVLCLYRLERVALEFAMRSTEQDIRARSMSAQLAVGYGSKTRVAASDPTAEAYNDGTEAIERVWALPGPEE